MTQNRHPSPRRVVDQVVVDQVVVDPAAVHLSGLRKTYGSTVAVDHVELVIAPGEIVALLGPNGAGKSTTIDLLLGLAAPEAGSVSIFGLAPTAACAAGRVGAMLQSGGLPPEMSVRDLVELMRALYPRSRPLADVLDRGRVTDLADRRADSLSGGETQRVRFALALVPDPDLLVLDEPTAAMDVESRQSFWSAMRDWADGGRTVLFATHYLEEADAFADRIVVMRHGQVVADAAPAEIRALSGGRVVRGLVDPAAVPTRAELEAMPGVTRAVVAGPALTLHCADSDAALRALLADQPTLHDIEVSAPGLDEAFLALTADPADHPSPNPIPRAIPNRIPDHPQEMSR
jgi:ABC-2 type transport system ATP-binding protein